MKAKDAVLMLLVILLGCKKGGGPNITVSTTLTDCPANSTCTYSYYDNADFTGANPPVKGSYRVFSYQSVNMNLCGATSQFYFKTNPGDATFDITANQIVSGDVFANDFICPCCEYAVLFKPVGGEIKGKRTDATHWLVNASIIFGVSAASPVDTLVVNQYFTRQPSP